MGVGEGGIVTPTRVYSYWHNYETEVSLSFGMRASSQFTALYSPLPLMPVRRRGWVSRSGPWTCWASPVATFAQILPRVKGLALLPRTSSILPFLTPTDMLQVSAQSRGQTAG